MSEDDYRAHYDNNFADFSSKGGKAPYIPNEEYKHQPGESMSFNTPQKINQKLVFGDFEANNQNVQTLACFPEQSQPVFGQGSRPFINRSSNKYLMNENSEEK